MELELLVKLVVVGAVYLVPIVGLTVILTTRFAFKPLVEATTTALRDSDDTPRGVEGLSAEEIEVRLALMEENVRHLKEAATFDRMVARPPTRPRAAPDQDGWTG